MIVFAGFAKVLRRLSVMTFSAKQFAFLCETFTGIVNIIVYRVWGLKLGLLLRLSLQVLQSFVAIVSVDDRL